MFFISILDGMQVFANRARPHLSSPAGGGTFILECVLLVGTSRRVGMVQEGLYRDQGKLELSYRSDKVAAP